MKTKFKKVMYLMSALMLAFFVTVVAPMQTVKAATLNDEAVCSSISGDGTKLVRIHYLGDTTGVTEVDTALNNLKKLIVGVVRVFGAIAALVGIIIAVLGFTSHNREQQWAGVIVAIAGFIVIFAPEIVNAISGKTLL